MATFARPIISKSQKKLDRRAKELGGKDVSVKQTDNGYCLSGPCRGKTLQGYFLGPNLEQATIQLRKLFA